MEGVTASEFKLNVLLILSLDCFYFADPAYRPNLQ